MLKRLILSVLSLLLIVASAVCEPILLNDADIGDHAGKTEGPPVAPVKTPPFFATIAPYIEKDYHWEVNGEKNGHTLSVSETPWSRYRTFKAETVIDQPIEVLLEVLLDVNGFAAWLPDCLRSGLLKTFGRDRFQGHFLVHVIWDSIWPITDRDFIIEVVSRLDWKNDQVTVELISVDDSGVPVAPGTKRLKKFYSRYHFAIIDRYRTRVSYSMVVDPDLPFPRKLVEIQTASIPFKTLEGLAERAKDPVFLKRAAEELY